MHKLGHIEIRNFRLCQSVSLPLEGFTPLVGQNNVGKSTILRALAWVLKPSSLQLDDFSDASKPVEVCARIDGISVALLDQMPEQKHRTAIEPYCINGSMWIRVIANGIGSKSVKPEIYDYEKYLGQGVPDAWRDYPTGLPQAVSSLLPNPLQIEAMEDIGEDLGKAKAGTTIKALLDEIMGPILKAHGELNAALASVQSILSAGGAQRSQHLLDFDTNATSALDSFFPGLELDLDMQLIDAKEFFKAADLHVTDKTTGDRRKFDQMGTGAQRAIQMSLIRYLAETQSNAGGNVSRRLLLIDEPELYLHPQGVQRLRQALSLLSQGSFQVVFSTHSPLMLSRENAADTVIVNKCKDHGTNTRQPLRQAVASALQDAGSQSRTLFELGNIAEIYFAERVVLCEGKTDRRLLPLAYERLHGHPSELDQISFVSLGSCSDIPKAIPVLKAMGIKVCAVADLDFAFTEARKGNQPLLPKDDNDLTNVKVLLEKLRAVHGFELGGNGLPVNQKHTQNSWQAADVWALMVKDIDGKSLADNAHIALKEKSIWVWPVGCIEQVTGHADKGEDAILEQESKLRSMTSEDVMLQFPAFEQCFKWIEKQ